MTNKEVQLKKYSLFAFTGELMPEGLLEVDCVPSSWIRYDDQLCSCVVHYPGPPYTEEDKRLLVDLISAQAEAPEDWPWYSIELRGHADNFNKGLKRTKVLGKKPFAYTTDSETHAKEKADEMTGIFKNQRKQVGKTVEDLLEISEDSDLLENEDDSNDYLEGTSSAETFTACNKTKKNLRKPKKVITSKKVVRQGNLSQGKPRSLTGSKTKSLNSGKREQSPKFTEMPIHSKPLPKDNLPKNNGVPERILETIKKHADNPNLVLRGTASLSDNNIAIQKSLSEAPTVLQDIVKDFPKDTALIYLAVKKLTLEVTSVVNELQGLRSSIARSSKMRVDQVSIVSFVEKYNFAKLSTVADFEAFDEQLKNDNYVKDLKIAMECLLESDLQRTITSIIKKFFHRVLAMQCTAYRKSRDKFLLKGTKFYDLLFDFVIRFHKGPTGGVVTEKEYYNTLSSCLTNAKDWEGNRKNRQVPIIAVAPALALAVAPVAAAGPGARMATQPPGIIPAEVLPME